MRSNTHHPHTESGHIPWGIDWISLSVQLKSPPTDPARWELFRPPYRYLTTVGEPGATTRIEVKRYRGGLWAFVQANPSRTWNPQTWRAVPAPDVFAPLSNMVDRTVQVLTPSVPPEQWGVSRVDVTVDIATGGVGPYLHGLAQVPRPANAGSPCVYFDPDRRGAQTLLVRAGKTGKAGSISLYDKHGHRPDAPPGTARFEARAKKAWARRYGGIYVLGDLTVSRIYGLGDDRLEWSKMDSQVVSMGVFLHTVDRLPLPEREKVRVCGKVFLALARREPFKGREYGEVRRVLKETRLAPSLDLEEALAPVAMRLDFATGVEVVDGIHIDGRPSEGDR